MAQTELQLEDVTDKLEHLAQQRLETGGMNRNVTPEGQALSKQMCDLWRSLSQEERAMVANEMVLKYDNASFNTLPRPHIDTNPQGEMIGIGFHASQWDRIPGTRLDLVAAKGMITVKIQDRGEFTEPDRFQ